MIKPLREIAHQITWLKFAGWHLNAVRVRKTHPEGLVPPVPKRVIVEPTNAFTPPGLAITVLCRTSASA